MKVETGRTPGGKREHLFNADYRTATGNQRAFCGAFGPFRPARRLPRCKNCGVMVSTDKGSDDYA